MVPIAACGPQGCLYRETHVRLVYMCCGCRHRFTKEMDVKHIPHALHLYLDTENAPGRAPEDGVGAGHCGTVRGSSRHATAREGGDLAEPPRKDNNIRLQTCVWGRQATPDRY